MIKFSVHTNKAGITITVPETRNTRCFQVCLCFWSWNRACKGPALMFIAGLRAEALSAAGYFSIDAGTPA